MSRGPGRIQRAVLDYLHSNPEWNLRGIVPAKFTMLHLACHVHGVAEVTDSQLASVRRAVRTLAKTGAVRTYRANDGRRHYRARRGDWITNVVIPETFVQRAMTDDEKSRHKQWLIAAGYPERAMELYP